MKGFLTFTLAAGVAITTSSIGHAAGVVKGAANATKAPAAAAQTPMGVSRMGITLDRLSLTRELDRLNEEFTAQEGEESATATLQKTQPTWTF